jgi:hypothetical protein
MSCIDLVSIRRVTGMSRSCPGLRLTKDRRYESKDSREMLNGSFSSYAHRVMEEEVVDRDEVVPQNDLRSVGGGGR